MPQQATDGAGIEGISAVLWDMDGTLVDTEPDWIASEFELIEAYGGTWSHEHAMTLVGNDLLESGRYIHEHAGIALEPAVIVEELLDRVSARVAETVPWRPGARELLTDLRDRGVRCALVTMSYRRFVTPILATLPPGTFEVVVTGDSVSQGKPHPEPYLKAAAALGVDPGRAVAIEDSDTGVRSAVAAGCTVLVVKNHVPVLDGERRVFAETLAGMTAVDLPVPGVPQALMPDTTARVSALARFPVKACGAEPLTSADLTEVGVRDDRLLAVVVEDRIVTQREFARLASVRPTLDDASRELTLRLAGGPDGMDRLAGAPGAADGVEGGYPARSTIEMSGRRRTVTLFGEPVDVVDQGPELSGWFSELLGVDAVLVAAPESSRRRSPGVVEGSTLLSDEGSVSLHSTASLAELNARLAALGRDPVTADRFRANIVVDGVAAYAEDRAARFTVGGVELGFAQVDDRCVVTTVDQVLGTRSGPEPVRTLATYRRGPGGVQFGIYTAVLVAGRVSVGDPVTLHDLPA